MLKQYTLLSLILAGLCLAAPAHAAPKKVWITLGDAAFTQLKTLAPALQPAKSQLMSASVAGVHPEQSQVAERAHAVEVDEALLANLSGAVHESLHRCGGFIAHASRAEALAALDGPAPGAKVAAPSYTISQQAVVTPLLAQMQDSNIASTIVDMSAFTNRYYTTNNGVNAANWLMNRWKQLAGSRSDIKVEQFTHAAFPQKSVIMTFAGTDNAGEVVVLGGHLDSINGAGTSETTRAPGADDDASGIASLTEAARAMIASGYKPRRTIKFIGYAAEEVGLRGSQDIAKKFKADQVNVVGVMQLDMTNYKGSDKDIYIYTDYTNSAQNSFVANLISTYLPTLQIGYDRCGYGCSDHASWYNQGYATSMPFEAAFNDDDPYIHTANDTFANTGNQALHALKFGRLAAAFAVELGSGGTVQPPNDKVETFTANIAKGEKRNYGPFKVAAGGRLLAELSGSGDGDLYGKTGAAPTTSSYDCRPYKTGSAESCTINVTANSDVYLMVNGYAAASYTLKVTYRAQ